MNQEEQVPLLLTLKPRHAVKLFEGLKTAELRRRIALGIENRSVFVYVSSPISELRGGFRVGKVWKGSPNSVWKNVDRMAKVTKNEFDTYFEGCEIAFGLEIRNVWEYENPLSFKSLERKLTNFVIPQSWRYLRENEHDYLKRPSLTRLHPTRL